MSQQLQSGDWVWAESIGSAVQVQSVTELWDTTSIECLDQEGRVHHVLPSDIQPLDTVTEEISKPRTVTHQAAGARLAHHLNLPTTLTAPFRSGLDPLPHQMKHLEEALSRDTTRLLLADEVGLGKTITAALILTELKHRGVADRILVLTPAGLIAQWIQELRQHFNIHLTPLFTDLMATPNTARVWTQYDHVIASYDSVKPLEKRRGWSAEKIRAYNENRFEGLIEADWDIVVIDEAHRVAGATPGVARHAVASGLSTVAPHLLLLTGTPHQGKIGHFHRLVQLLDADTFSTPDTITPENLRPHLLRTDKRHAVTLEGEPLFVDRRTDLVPLPERLRTDQHRRLYTEVTEYIRTGYAAAEKDTRSGIGFLMVLVQRLLASSTTALEETLRKRLDFLTTPDWEGDNVTDDEFLDPDSDLHEESLHAQSFGTDVEVRTLQKLLELIDTCQRGGPDPKAKFLLDLLLQLQQQESDPSAKFLIFTEFTGTQRMLASYLERHGYEVATLNGSMGLEERIEAQRAFEEEAQVLVSTEAGGEGLNLQFCHLVINYDLPWNPMRIEQRIGRVHRIGQDHPVEAYNLVLGGTVEHRVVEVLSEKLDRILEQLGIDKLSDVLDTPALDKDFEEVYKSALTEDDEIEEEIDALVSQIQDQAKHAKDDQTLRPSELNLERIKRRLQEPVPFWLNQFAENAEPPLEPDLRSKGTRTALDQIERWVPETPVPKMRLPSLPATVSGYWSLWRVGVRDGTENVSARYHPVLLTDDGLRRGPTVARIWDALIGGDFDPDGHLVPSDSKEALEACTEAAQTACRGVYDELLKAHEELCDEQLQRHETSVRARRTAIASVGLPEVRRHRTEKLEAEDQAWREQHKRRRRTHPILEPILITRVRGEA